MVYTTYVYVECPHGEVDFPFLIFAPTNIMTQTYLFNRAGGFLFTYLSALTDASRFIESTGTS